MWMLYLFGLVRNKWASPWRRRLLGTARVCAYLTVVSAAASVLLASRALGRIHDEASVLGRELLPLADLLDGVTMLNINGERLNVSVTTVGDTSVRTVLDRIERHCDENPGPLARTLRAAANSVPEGLPRGGEVRDLLRRAALTREETPVSGSVLCLTGRPGQEDTSELGETFAKTRDLGVLGNLRYVTVRRGDAEDGEGDRVKVMALFTEGSFRLSSLEPPPNTDAPGSDSKLIPRPPGGVRLFSAEAAGAPYAVRIYETEQAPAVVLSFYDDAMKAFASPFDASGDPVRAFIDQNGQSVLIRVDTDEAKTLVTLSELGVHDALPRRGSPVAVRQR